MAQAYEYSISIPLSDGRTVIAAPRPEDKDRLELIGERTLSISSLSNDMDTQAHSFSSDITVDVEGHAMTLRLPTPSDAEALRRGLAAGAITATIVAAGAIAALQGNPGAPAAPANVDTSLNVNVSQPLQMPHAQPDFANRKDSATEQMLAAPPMQGAPSDVATEREFTHGPASGAVNQSSSGNPGQAATGATDPNAQSDFQSRKDAQTDEMLSAPAMEGAPSDVDTR